MHLTLGYVHYRPRTRWLLWQLLRVTGILTVMQWVGFIMLPTRRVKVDLPFTPVEGSSDLSVTYDGVIFVASTAEQTVASQRIQPPAGLPAIGFELAANRTHPLT